MSLAEDYRPCKNCGTFTDSGVCSESCAGDLQAAKLFKDRLVKGEIDEDGNELGERCDYCGEWFKLDGDEDGHFPYCSWDCAYQVEGD